MSPTCPRDFGLYRIFCIITSISNFIKRFYDNCQVYKREVENNPSALMEYHKFLESHHMKRVATKVKSRLNHLDRDVVAQIKLSHRDLDAIFIGCSYEISMFGGSLDEGLCSLLDETDREVLEYAEDLENFYLAGNPLNPLTYRIACPLLKDIIQSMKNAIEGKTIVQGVFRSAHSTAVLMFFTLLGVNQHSEPLTSINFEKQIKNDKRFRSSNISPFAANANFVLYDCGSGIFKVQLYWNEKLQKLPCCKSSVDCDFADFLAYFQEQIDQCDAEDLCKEKESQHVFPSERNLHETLKTDKKVNSNGNNTEEDGRSSSLVKLFAFLSLLVTILKSIVVNWVGRNWNRLYPKQK